MSMHDHSASLSPDVYDSTECASVLIDLPCACQDVVYACGFVDYEHDHVVCDGVTPAAAELTREEAS